MHRPALVAHSSFIEGSHTTKNTASGETSTDKEGAEKISAGKRTLDLRQAMAT
jgi:hypothetical protein